VSTSGHLTVSPVLGKGVDVAPPSWGGRIIPLFILAYQENSSPANREGSGAVAMGPVTHSQPGGSASYIPHPWVTHHLRPTPHHVMGHARELSAT